MTGNPKNFHAGAWLAWAGAILVVLSATRNPWYLALVLLWVAAVSRAARTVQTGAPPVPLSPLRFGLFVVAFAALFNALTVHFGDTVLFTLPAFIPFFGGPVTLEALVFGALNGLVLAGMFSAFTVLNRALPVRAMLRLVPRAFYPVAVVVSIAVTFVPVTLRQFRQIREAQAVRGHRMRGLQDWLPLLMPLLVGGLERALQLAEAITARGFAATEAASYGSGSRLAVIGGMALLLAGWLLRLVWGWAGVGLAALLAGLGLVGGVVWQIGRRVPHTIYRPQPWTSRDWVVTVAAALAAAAFLFPASGPARDSVYYYPYPSLTLPALHWMLVAAGAGLLAPAALLARRPSLSSPIEAVT